MDRVFKNVPDDNAVFCIYFSVLQIPLSTTDIPVTVKDR